MTLESQATLLQIAMVPASVSVLGGIGGAPADVTVTSCFVPLPTGHVVLDDDAGGAVEVGVDIDVTGPQVALHDEFVLLPVAPADHQVVLRRDEPQKLLKPGE